MCDNCKEASLHHLSEEHIMDSNKPVSKWAVVLAAVVAFIVVAMVLIFLFSPGVSAI